MSQEHKDDLSDMKTSEIRGGDKVGGVRYVLAISLVSALVLLFVVMGVLG